MKSITLLSLCVVAPLAACKSDNYRRDNAAAGGGTGQMSPCPPGYGMASGVCEMLPDTSMLPPPPEMPSMPPLPPAPDLPY